MLQYSIFYINYIRNFRKASIYLRYNLQDKVKIILIKYRLKLILNYYNFKEVIFSRILYCNTLH